MSIVKRSVLVSLSVNIEHAQVGGATHWRVGAWDDEAQAWVGKPENITEGLDAGDPEQRKKLNDAITVAAGNALAEVGRLRAKLGEASVQLADATIFAQTAEKASIARIAELLRENKELKGRAEANLVAAQGWKKDFDTQTDLLAEARAKMRANPLLRALTFGRFGR